MIEGLPRILPCEECTARNSAREAQQQLDRSAGRQREIRQNLETIGVNVWRYVDQRPATLETFDPDPDNHALAAARRFVEEFRNRERPSLYLFGRRPAEPIAAGNGKTHLAVAILRELALDPHIAISQLRFIFVPELLLEIQDTFESSERRTLQVVREYSEPELLVWDDLGAEKLSDFATRTLYTVLYKREGRSNIFTSNLSLDQIAARDPYAERITSRIAGDAEIIELVGPDRRATRRPKVA